MRDLNLELLRWRVHRSLLRSCVRHDESWVSERAVLAHDKELGRRIESLVMREGRAPWLELTDEERLRVREDVFGPGGGPVHARADWKRFVPELRTRGDVDRMRRSDLRLLFAGHMRRQYERAAARRR